MNTLRMARAFVRRDFRIERTYRLAFFSQLLSASVTLLSAGFLSEIVPAQAALQPYGDDYFTFVLVGTAALSYFSVALSSFASNLSQEQEHGTLEFILTTPNDPRALLVCGAAFPFIFATVQLIAYLVVGAALFSADLPPNRLWLAGLMLFLSVILYSALGLLAAAVIMVTKRGAILISLTAGLFALFGGVLYPISVLPGWLQFFANILPMSHGLEAVRLSLVEDLDVAAIARNAAVVVAWCVVLVPSALQGFRWAVDRARRTGTIGHY